MIFSFRKFILIFAYIYNKVSCNDKIIRHEYEIYHKAIKMNIRFKSLKSITLPIDLNSKYTIIKKESYYHEIEFIQSMTTEIEKNITVNTEEQRSPFYLTKNFETIPNMPVLYFLYLSPPDNYTKTIQRYAMAYDIPNKNHSITHLLKANGLIEEASFTLHKMKKSPIQNFYFGGIPQEVRQGLTKRVCNIKKEYNEWRCDLSKMTIGNITYINTNPVYFSTNTREIRVPPKVYDLIINQLFSKDVSEYKKDKNRIQVHFSFIDLITQLSFVFDNFIIRLESQDLFIDHDKVYEFMIIPNTDDTWVLGYFFLEKYITKFDYDNNQIVFYSQQRIDLVENSNITNPQTKNIIFIIIILIIIGLLVLSYSQFQLRNTKAK